MPLINELFRRLRYLLYRRRFDQELAGDLEFHREMAEQAGRQFNHTLQLREEAREAWGWTWIDRFSQDLHYAFRMLRKSPGFTLAAVLTLGFGIGVNVAAFGFFNMMFLRPLPVRDPAAILHFQRRSPEMEADNFPYAAVAFYGEHSKTLSSVLAASLAKLALEGEQKQVAVLFVTANFFSDLGAPAGLGRLLDPARDGAANAEPVVVLSHGFWQSQFGADPSIVGKTIRLNHKPVTVAGVAGRQFSSLELEQPALWAPITQQPYFVGGSNGLTDFSFNAVNVQMWGRLQPGLTPKAVEAELNSLAAELHRQHPAGTFDKETLPSEPGGFASSIRPTMVPVLILAGALVLLILAVACGNLGSLLLARGVARSREIGIRVSVGAGSGRLVRQLFTESLLLALLGSMAALALGYAVLKSLMALVEVPEWLNPAPDWRVIVFALGTGFIASILFGLTPALQIARQRHRATISRQILVGAQVAGSCVLLIVAGLLVRALDHAASTHPGFDYQQVISIDPHLYSYSPANARVYLDTLEGRLRNVPGVESVSLASNPPLGNRWTVGKTEIAGRKVNIHFNNVTPAFFETMKIPLLRGRNLLPGDKEVIVISESLARIQWPSEDPLGKPFRRETDASGAPINYTVVGIVGSARLVSPEDSDAVEAYQLAGSDFLHSLVMLVRTSVPPERMIPLVASITRAIDPSVFPEVQMMKNSYRQNLQTAKTSALVVSLLGFLALLLACLGIVGVVAYAVSQRTKEIGIRMALGAKPSQVVSIVLRQFSRPVVIGLVAGVGGAAALSQILRGMLYGVSNLDPVTYGSAIAIFAVSVALAALMPARRALRVDPMRALRYD